MTINASNGDIFVILIHKIKILNVLKKGHKEFIKNLDYQGIEFQ